MKRWLTVFVMITGVFLFLSGVAFAQSNFDNTLQVVIKGDRRLIPRLQQAVWDYLRPTGLNVVMPKYSRNTPYRLLVVQIDRQSGGPNTNFGFQVGGWSNRTTIHYDTVSAIVTLYSPGGYNAMPLSSGIATCNVERWEGRNDYRSRYRSRYRGHYSGSVGNSGTEKLEQAAVQVVLQALGQIQLTPSTSF